MTIIRRGHEVDPVTLARRAGNKRRYSAKEKLELLNQFRDDSQRATSREMAAKLGVSLASINRWSSREGTLRGEAARAVPITSGISVEDAIKVLIDSSKPPDYRTTEAIMAFSAWLRYPANTNAYNVSFACLALTYIKHVTGVDVIGELSEPYRSYAAKHISIETVLSAFRFDLYDMAFLGERAPDENEVNEIDLITDTAAFFVADETSPEREGKPSLGKAYYLASHGGFRHGSLSGRYKWFQTFIVNSARALPFVLVEQKYSKLDWHLDPKEDDLVARVNELLNHRSIMKQFFRNSLWVIQRLESRLDPRLLKRIAFPKLPSVIEPAPITLDPLPSDIVELLRDYRSAEKYT